MAQNAFREWSVRLFARQVFRLAELMLIAEGREVTTTSVCELVDALSEPTLRSGLLARLERYPTRAPGSLLSGPPAPDDARKN